MPSDITVSYPQVRPSISNRVRAFLIHTPWYSIEGQCRLAQDCGVSCSTVSRLVRNQSAPSYKLARAVTDSLSKRLGVPLDMREIFTTDGTYLTSCVCDLAPACKGCFPPEAYDQHDSLKAAYQGQKPGDWCTYPLWTVQQ